MSSASGCSTWVQWRTLGDLRTVVDDALGDREPARELEVVAGRAHDDRDRHAPDADLERLLAHDPIETRVHRVGDPLAARDREGGGVGLVVVDHGEVAIQTISRVQSSSS